MKAVLEKIAWSAKQSFALKEDILPYIQIGWHHHPEYELTLISESRGVRVVGDHVAHFAPGDLLLIGPNLPHYMRNDPEYQQGRTDLRMRAIVLHFAEDFLGKGFFETPELAQIRQVLRESARGIHVYGASRDRIAPMMEQMIQQQGFARLQQLLAILDLIATSPERNLLSSPGFTNVVPQLETDRISQVFSYLLQHFQRPLSLGEMAEQIHLSPSAFCKFLKKRSGRTFSQLLNEIRIGHACKLLIEQDWPVGQIAFQCGYRHATYFTRQFKSITGHSPLQYRRSFHRSN